MGYLTARRAGAPALTGLIGDKLRRGAPKADRGAIVPGMTKLAQNVGTTPYLGEVRRDVRMVRSTVGNACGNVRSPAPPGDAEELPRRTDGELHAGGCQ